MAIRAEERNRQRQAADQEEEPAAKRQRLGELPN
jgi:hypothetical protein